MAHLPISPFTALTTHSAPSACSPIRLFAFTSHIFSFSYSASPLPSRPSPRWRLVARCPSRWAVSVAWRPITGVTPRSCSPTPPC